MTDDMFAEEIVFSARRRARWALVFGALGLGIGMFSLGALMLALPLKDTEVHVLLVDAETGLTERLASVQQAPLTTEHAITEAIKRQTPRNTLTYFAGGMSSGITTDRATGSQWDSADPARTPVWSDARPVRTEIFCIQRDRSTARPS